MLDLITMDLAHDPARPLLARPAPPEPPPPETPGNLPPVLTTRSAPPPAITCGKLPPVSGFPCADQRPADLLLAPRPPVPPAPKVRARTRRHRLRQAPAFFVGRQAKMLELAALLSMCPLGSLTALRVAVEDNAEPPDIGDIAEPSIFKTGHGAEVGRIVLALSELQTPTLDRWLLAVRHARGRAFALRPLRALKLAEKMLTT